MCRVYPRLNNTLAIMSECARHLSVYVIRELAKNWGFKTESAKPEIPCISKAAPWKKGGIVGKAIILRLIALNNKAAWSALTKEWDQSQTTKRETGDGQTVPLLFRLPQSSQKLDLGALSLLLHAVCWILDSTSEQEMIVHWWVVLSVGCQKLRV